MNESTFQGNKYTLQLPRFIKHFILAFTAVFAMGLVSFGQCGQGQLVQLQGAESITIDGLATESAWARVTPSPILSVTTGQMPADFAGTQWRGMWDNTYLYIFVQVHDLTIRPGNGPSGTFYQYDAVEIFIGGNQPTMSSYDATDHQYGFSIGTSGVVFDPTGVTTGPNNQSNSTAGINYAVKMVPGVGYNMEIEIPWSLIGGTPPTLGKNVGFDVAIDDDDNNSGTRDGQASWHTSGFNEYQDALQFAVVPLVNCTPPPLTVTPLSSNLTCSGLNDGVASAAATGGTGPYSFQLQKAGIDTLAPVSSSTGVTFSNLSAGTYTISVTDATPTTVTSSNIVLTTFVNTLTAKSNVSSVCKGSPATLTASGGTTYAWTASPSGVSAGFQTPTDTALSSLTVKPTVTTKYTVTTYLPTNLILNSGFESGNIGFSSDYVYLSSSQLPTLNTYEVYGIVNKSNVFNTSFNTPAPFFDNTLGTAAGHMLTAAGAIQGSAQGTSPILPANARIWSQTITVTSGTQYTFSYYLRAANTTTPQATIQTKINGVQVGAITTATTAGWTKVSIPWTATTGSAIISLYDTNGSSSGNDFAIDDLSFTAPCPLTNDTTITVNPADTAYFVSNDTSICSGNNVAIVLAGTTGATVNYTTKDLKTGVTSTTNSIVLDPTTGLATISATNMTDSTVYLLQNVTGGTTNCSFTLTATDTVNVLPLPTAAFAGNDTAFCAGGTANIVFTGTPNAIITYDSINLRTNTAYNNLSIPLNSSGSVLLSATVNDSMLYQLVSVARSGTIGCTQPVSGTKKVSITQANGTISGGGTICSGTATNAITFNGVPAAATISYSTNINGTIDTLSASLSGGTYTIPSTTLADTAVYTLIKVAGSAACSKTITGQSATINVVPVPSATIVAAASPICSGSATSIIFTGTNNTTANYTISNGSTATNKSINLDGAADSIPTGDLTAASTTYKITNVQYNTAPSCPNTTNQSVTVTTSTVTPPTTTTLITYCVGSVAKQLTATSIQPVLTFFWYTPDSPNGSDVAPIPSTDIAGSAEYYVSSIQGAGTNTCQSVKDTITVIVNPKSAYAGGPELRVVKGATLLIPGVATPGNAPILWTAGNSSAGGIPISNDTIATPTVGPFLTIPATDPMFIMQVGNICPADSVRIMVLEPLVIPNAFTPNGDGVHDYWEIQNINQYFDAEVNIYNRYGQLVFAQLGYTKPWDGTYNGQPLPVGPYYYIITLNDGAAPMKGCVSIIR